MTREQYLDRYQEVTSAQLAEIALNLGREEFTDATTQLTDLRVWQDGLWDQYREAAAREVAP